MFGRLETFFLFVGAFESMCTDQVSNHGACVEELADEADLLQVQYDTSKLAQRANDMAAAINSGSGAENDLGSLRVQELVKCATAPASDKSCFDTLPPATFAAKFVLNGGGSFTVQVNSSWAPPFAQRFWQLVNLGWYNQTAVYRNDYINSSSDCSMNSNGACRFVSQWGLKGVPEVDAAWTNNKTSHQGAPVIMPNTRGKITFSMGAVTCDSKLGSKDPCATLRSTCTSTEYCAQGFTTEVFVNYANNSYLDESGFPPFGEVDAEGMNVFDRLGKALGAEYGEVAELCENVACNITTPTYCRFKANCAIAGVNATVFGEQGNPYIRSGFPLMWKMRVRSVELVS